MRHKFTSNVLEMLLLTQLLLLVLVDLIRSRSSLKLHLSAIISYCTHSVLCKQQIHSQSLKTCHFFFFSVLKQLSLLLKHELGTIFSCVLIHMWWSGEYLWQQVGVCVFTEMKEHVSQSSRNDDDEFLITFGDNGARWLRRINCVRKQWDQLIDDLVLFWKDLLSPVSDFFFKRLLQSGCVCLRSCSVSDALLTN